MLIALGALVGWADEPWRMIYPEQRCLEVRSPSQLRHAPIPDCPTPQTVATPKESQVTGVRHITLDEAIRLALENSPAVRVLAGETAVLSGRTIYDPAISNTQIDAARGRFDPTLRVDNFFTRRDNLFPFLASLDPNDVRIGEFRTDDNLTTAQITKDTVTGGRMGVGMTNDSLRSTAPGTLLNPQRPWSAEMRLTQPLLQGAGPAANLAPIVVARIDTERSYFQTKQSVQQMVLGVVQAYWALVNARIDVFARGKQFEQGEEGLRLAEARADAGFGDEAEVAQARSALSGFHATLISANGALLQREGALRSMLQLPPEDGARLVPVTLPIFDRVDPKWEEILQLAETYRPDLIETKLIIEADQQQLLMAKNRAMPQLDAVGVYRWNGLEGRTPDDRLISDTGRLGEWQIGVNFSVPLGLRTARAGVRRQELILTKDRTYLEEQLRDTSHVLAAHYRNVAQYYAQYKAFQDTCEAARTNVRVQFDTYHRRGKGIYLDVLQAITQWGNSVSSMALAATQYNAELAALDLQTGTILEVHGIRFAEERYASIGPMGRLGRERCYPMASRPGDNEPHYKDSDKPSEEAFDLQSPYEADEPPPPPRMRDPRLEQPPESIGAMPGDAPRPSPPRQTLPRRPPQSPSKPAVDPRGPFEDEPARPPLPKLPQLPPIRPLLPGESMPDGQSMEPRRSSHEPPRPVEAAPPSQAIYTQPDRATYTQPVADDPPMPPSLSAWRRGP